MFRPDLSDKYSIFEKFNPDNEEHCEALMEAVNEGFNGFDMLNCRDEDEGKEELSQHSTLTVTARNNAD